MTTTTTTTTTTSTARRRRMVGFAAAAAVAALVAAACGSDTTPAADPAAPATTEPSATAATAAEPAGAAADRHDCETISAVRHGDLCRVGGQWWAPDGSGGWVESDEPSAPTTTVAQTGTVADIEEDGESPRESEVPSEQVCIDGVCLDVPMEEEEAQEEEFVETGEWVGAETDDPVAVVDPVAVQEAGQTIAESEPIPEPVTTTTAAPEPEPVTTTTAAPEPEPEHEHEQPEPEPEPEASLPDCVPRTVLDTPCIDRNGVEQNVQSQLNESFGGGYIGGDWYMDTLSTIGDHPRDHDNDTHRVTVSDPDWIANALGDPAVLEAVHPAARGARPQPMPGHGHGHLPPFTPAVQAWSDWCFFDFEMTVNWPDDVAPPADSTYFCSVELHRMAFHLSHLGASEDCILPSATAMMEAAEQRALSWFTPSGSPERAAMAALGRASNHLHCPNVIYPDPDAVVTLEDHYALVVLYGGQAGTSFADFAAGARDFSSDGEPSQLLLRSNVIGRIPNFTAG